MPSAGFNILKLNSEGWNSFGEDKLSALIVIPLIISWLTSKAFILFGIIEACIDDCRSSTKIKLRVKLEIELWKGSNNMQTTSISMVIMT